MTEQARHLSNLRASALRNLAGMPRSCAFFTALRIALTGRVHAPDLMTAARQIEGVLSSAATGIQHAPRNPACFFQADDGEKKSNNFYKATFGDGGNTMTGAWQWPGGGYKVVGRRE